MNTFYSDRANMYDEGVNGFFDRAWRRMQTQRRLRRTTIPAIAAPETALAPAGVQPMRRMGRGRGRGGLGRRRRGRGFGRRFGRGFGRRSRRAPAWKIARAKRKIRKAGFDNLGVPAFRLMTWIKNNEPAFYEKVKEQFQQDGETLSGLGQNIFDSIGKAAQSYFQLRQQRDMIKLQTRRAEKGLPPLDVSKLTGPPISVQIDAGPEIQRAIEESAGTVGKKMQTPLLLGGAALLAFLLLRKR